MSRQEKNYCDILILGKTGFGKSTTANKLLGIDLPSEQRHALPQSISSKLRVWGAPPGECLYNVVGSGTYAFTRKCKLISNESSSIRVLDTPGFADEISTTGSFETNYQTLREVKQCEKDHHLQFSRVVYFLPFRGPPPTRIDGNQQEEIYAIHGVLGREIIQKMVFVATQHDGDRYQKMGYPEEDIAEVQKLFREAFHEITNDRLSAGAHIPIVFLPIRASYHEVQNAIYSAKLLEPSAIRAAIRSNFYCEEKCVRCAIQVIQVRKPSGEKIPIKIRNTVGKEEDYTQSECHPIIIPKYTTITKIIGGVAHIATLGMPLIYGVITGTTTWPGFTNADEKCPICDHPPGTRGCSPVGQEVTFGSPPITIKTDHSTTSDKVLLQME